MPMTTQQKATLPSGPRPLPIVGNLLDFRRDQLGYLQRLQQTYGNMATIYAGTTPIVTLFRPEYVRYILTENPRNFTNREIAKNLCELIGDGLLTIDGDTHRQQRRMVQPAFHKKRVEGYATVMTQHTCELLETWHAGQKLDMAHAMQELTLRIVARCLFHVDLAREVDELGHAFSEMIGNPVGLLEGLLGLRINLPFTAYGRRTTAKQRIDTFIYRLIAQRRADGHDMGDVLSMLLAAQDEGDETSKLTDTQIRDHIMTFVAAGHETTTNALTWTFYLLSQHPTECKKLLAEIQNVLGTCTATVDDIPNLPYTEWVLNELMRLYPPAWNQGRRATESFDLDGYHFPAGTFLTFSQWVIHRLPDIWGDPTVFRPERWDPVNGQPVPAWSYFPFGGGPRICIGMPFAQLEAKLLLVTILQHYTPRLAPGYHMKLHPLITLRPRYGMPMILEPTTAIAQVDSVPML